ncbi:MAG TPA: T9SS type A sorting domain-containing protein [Chitinophagaceae bacterium]|nr:T9SS type A sorting domain-containing protein [Chitinophagaceae bacterium]
MKNLPMLCLATLFFFNAHAQLLTVDPGASLTIQNGAQVHADGLTLIPSADFILSNVILSRSATVVHTQANPYISRVYQFSNTSNAFSGSIQINYTDGAELNGLAEANLTLNIHNGTNWAAYPASFRDPSENYVLTDGLINITLNELTLASQFAPLPLTWLSFTAKAQNNSQSLLQWATAQEQNTKDFYIEHSADGINWVTIGSLPAAGNSNSTIHYNYVHTNPVKGLNYYRIKQTDVDSRYSYSPIRMLSFTRVLQLFTILGNPVTNDVLTLQVNMATSLAFYTADGKLLWREQVNAGTKTIDVSRYAKGTYLLKTITTIQKVVIQ